MTIPRGAYGLVFPDLVAAPGLGPCRPEWPAVRIVCEPIGEKPGPTVVGDDRAELRLLGGGQLVLERAALRATFRTPVELGDGELVHPYLAPVGSVFAQWHERDSFHAGAFVADGVAWALLGDKQSGKSTTLAWLALRGIDVLTDDVLVLEEDRALAGPRCIDLRPDAVAGLEMTTWKSSREGSRRRLELEPLPAAVPLRGFVHLTWGDRVELDPVPPSERLRRLADHLGQRTSPRRILDLAALPFWELARPKRPELLPELAERLLALR